MAKKILIVDDSPVIIMSLKQTLEVASYEVLTASDGAEALDTIKGGVKPDLIITDINMPNMNGMDLIKNVRSLLRFIPILVLTTESESSKREEAKKIGATGWIVKPAQGQDILTVVKQVLPGA